MGNPEDRLCRDEAHMVIKCSKISNTFLFPFSNQDWNSHSACKNSKHWEVSDQTASSNIYHTLDLGSQCV